MPGVAQRVGRGIALLFHDRGTRRGWVVSSTPRPHFTAGKDPIPILQEAGWALGPIWTGGKFRPHRDSIPDLPARSQSYTNWATRPMYVCLYVRKSYNNEAEIISHRRTKFSLPGDQTRHICAPMHTPISVLCQLFVVLTSLFNADVAISSTEGLSYSWTMKYGWIFRGKSFLLTKYNYNLFSSPYHHPPPSPWSKVVTVAFKLMVFAYFLLLLFFCFRLIHFTTLVKQNGFQVF